MTLAFRTVDPASDELTGWLENVNLGFHDPHQLTPQRIDARRAGYLPNRLTGAFDGPLCVGTFRSWDTTLTVPGGGGVVADAISSVTVRPTHRRRGILTRLMTDDLAAAAERDVPVAILFASEAVIYGRYGFAPATWTSTVRVDVRRATLLPGVPRSGRVDVVDARRARAAGDAVFAATRRPGEIDLRPQWLDEWFGPVDAPGPTPAARRFALHTDDAGTVDGLLVYRVVEDWREREIRTEVTVEHLRTASPAAYLELWRYLLDLDLVVGIVAHERPVDEPLPALLTDARAVRRTAHLDFQWDRLLDPARALSARRYERSGSVVVEVVDKVGGWAAGRYTLEADDDGTGRCTRTPGASADLSVPVEVLSALWLGDGDLRPAVWAGRVDEHRPGAVARLGGLLRTAEPPWTPTTF